MHNIINIIGRGSNGVVIRQQQLYKELLAIAEDEEDARSIKAQAGKLYGHVVDRNTLKKSICRRHVVYWEKR
jgi:hypothetical protein